MTGGPWGSLYNSMSLFGTPKLGGENSVAKNWEAQKTPKIRSAKYKNSKGHGRETLCLDFFEIVAICAKMYVRPLASHCSVDVCTSTLLHVYIYEYYLKF